MADGVVKQNAVFKYFSFHLTRIGHIEINNTDYITINNMYLL